MRPHVLRRHRLALLTLGVLPFFGAASPAAVGRPSPLDATTNDNRIIAGVLRDGNYTIALEIRRATWHPNAPSALAVDVPAFAEVGGATSIPGPLIRVPAGTAVAVTIRNTLAERASIHGLQEHDHGRDSVVLAPGETRELRFRVARVGTFGYFARTDAAPTLFSRRDDSQLMGAFIVDPAGTDSPRANARERILVLTAWDDSVRNPASPYGPGQVYAINGRSWPFTERMRYTEGDSVHWRVLNLSQHSHPMHLHGTYFRVGARGTPFADSSRTAPARLAVTELLLAGETITMAWKAARAGNWLYHCHAINHIDEALRMGEAAVAGGHAIHSAVTDAMAGLVLAVQVEAKGAVTARNTTPRTRLRLFVTEHASPEHRAPTLSYVLQRGPREPARDSVELPGSLLELIQGVPTAITVINRGSRPTAVHWHGMELESLYDGVAGWSGAGARTAPIIAPGDSFVVHMTPPRAGTFIYHSHAGELAQLTGGLYGALIVRPRAPVTDPRERLILLSDSTADSLTGRTPASMINGRSAPHPIDLSAGATYRLRFISIGAVTRKIVRLLDGQNVLRWTPIAKDGADFPSAERHETAADQTLAAGETMDVVITPPHPGEWVLEVSSLFGPVTITRVPVRVR